MLQKSSLNRQICESDRDTLRKYFEISGILFIVLNRLGEVVSFNQELVDLLKMDASDIRGKNWFDNFVPERERSFVKDIFSKLLKGEIVPQQTVNVENAIINSSGEERIILWNNAIIDDRDNKNIYGTISSGMDITDKVRLREEQSLIIDILRLLNRSDSKIDIIKEILRLIKSHGGFEAVGIRLKEEVDYPYYDTLGFSQEFVMKEDKLCVDRDFNYEHDKCNECLCGLVISGQSKNLESSLFTKRGTFWTNNINDISSTDKEKINKLVYFRNTCFDEGYKSIALIPITIAGDIIGLLQLNDHRPYMFRNGIIKFYENVVESIGIALYRINIEEKIIQAKNKVEKTNGELEEFAYKASHDLREPLRTITSYVEMLQDSMNCSTDQQKYYFNKILDATSLLDQFIDDLLSYARIGSLTKIEDVDLAEICDMVVKNHDSLLKEKNGSVIYLNLPIIKNTKVLMLQLFQNLISNSLKYSDDGRKAVVQISAEDEHDFWHIKIEDNGIGISEKDYGMIFQMFKRITPNRYKGTGMGLAICKKIVESFGGKIWFTSELGKGTTFHLTLLKNGGQE